MNEGVIGLIPAAGKGLRLGLPYPKELYPIIKDNRYKPVSQFVLENMTASNIRHIIFVVNDTKHQLMGYFGNGHRFGCDISYVVQEPVEENRSTSPGLADALNSAYHLIKGQTVCFGMADTIMTPKDLFRLALDDFPPDYDVLLGLFPTIRPEKFGMVELQEDQSVARIVDKPTQTNLKLMWGIIVWKSPFTEHLHDCLTKKQIYDFAKIMNLAIQHGMKFRGLPFETSSYADLGTYEEIRELDLLYRSQI